MNTTTGTNLRHTYIHMAATTAEARAKFAQACAICARSWTVDGEFVLEQPGNSFGEGARQTGTANPVGDRTPTGKGGPARAARPAPRVYAPSEKALSYLDKLLATKEHTFTAAVTDPARTDAKVCSALIDALKEKAWKARETTPATTAAPLPEVPEAHYAVDGEDGETKFYRVDRPTEGKWAGHTFLKVQASDDYYPIKGAAARTILAKIAADPEAAALRYGREIGRCCRCNRTLTDEASRAAGIGPDCANKGW
jgi:hypothetical protein